MVQEIEIEFKNLLTENEYNHLLMNLPFPEESQRQINYYFETKDFSLSKNKCALRIREKENTYTLTIKQPHPKGILETNDPLTKLEAEKLIKGEVIMKPNIYRQLDKLNISASDLTYFGCLITERREIKLQDILLVLDYSTYNNRFDYELELEAPSKVIGLKTFNKLLAQYHITRKITPNKIERFFSSLSTNK